MAKWEEDRMWRWENGEMHEREGRLGKWRNAWEGGKDREIG